MADQWTAEETAALLEMRRLGDKLPEMAARLGRSYHSVVQKLQRLDYGLKPRFLIPQEHRVWYEKCRREWGVEEARRLLAKEIGTDDQGHANVQPAPAQLHPQQAAGGGRPLQPGSNPG